MYGVGFGYGAIGATTILKSGGASFDADAQSFFTASGITDLTQKNAVNQLVLDLKSNSLWSKMKALYPVVGGNATAHSCNLINTSAYQLTFSSGWTHASTGMLPNGTSAYADTNLNSNLLSLNSSTLLFYTTTNTDGVFVDMGNTDNVSENIILVKNGGSTLLGTNSAIGNRIAVSNTDSRGLYLLTRTASNVVKYFKNSNLINSSTAASYSTINRNVWISGWNNVNSVFYYSPRNVICSALADGLNDTESVNLSNAINTFNTTLGRNTY
jgi:hypothetical protein